MPGTRAIASLAATALLAAADAFLFAAGSLPAGGGSALYPGPSGQPVVDDPTPTNFAGETGVVPEPAQALLLGAGALVLAAARARPARSPA